MFDRSRIRKSKHTMELYKWNFYGQVRKSEERLSIERVQSFN